MATTATEKDDTWIRSICEMCIGACGILVHRVDGVAVKVEGDPTCPNCQGKICARGNASLMGLYDRNRLKTPMKRTNKEKGIGIDPGWAPISWEEAIGIMVEKLGKVRKDDPRKLVVAHFDNSNIRLIDDFGAAFGTPNHRWLINFCGDYLHSSMFLINGTFHCDFDAEHCNYLMLFGNQAGFGVGLNPNITAQKVAEARKRGMKVVAVDPICNHAASKADEWVPIRPGTDAALLLAMLNVLLNELGIYDADFLQKHTNGPYLVKDDGYYVRENDQPVVWDAAAAKAASHDAGVRKCALEGQYEVAGIRCRPAFQLLKEHVKKYSPEMVEGITTIPAATIRRLAREFGEAARIGSTIRIDGVELPWRPVAANIYRGAGAHSHGVAVALALETLNMVVGAFYVPGGHRGLNLIGPTWEPNACFDGLLLSPKETSPHAAVDYYHLRIQVPPECMDVKEFYPISTTDGSNFFSVSIDPEKFHLGYKPEVLIICRRNMFLGAVDYKATAAALGKYQYVIFFGTHLDENSDFADLVLPDKHFLEKFHAFPNSLNWSISPQTGQFYYGIRNPVVPPAGEARDWAEVLWDVADKMGFLGDIYESYNKRFKLQGNYKLDPSRRYTKEELFQRRTKTQFGEDKDLEWFRKNGWYSVRRTLKEQFPLPYLKGRFPLYYENIKKAGAMLHEMTEHLKMEWDISDYTPLPDWKPCPAYSSPENYDFFAVNFRVPTHSQSYTSHNVWLNEVAKFNPYAQRILIHTSAARKRGIEDGDQVRVESKVGKLSGIARVTECIHPETIGISGHFGGWTKNKPRALTTGANFNCLLSFDRDHIDPVSGGFDACVRVNVFKV